MNCKQIIPAQSLKPYIHCFWILKDDHLYDKPVTFKVVADGCPGLFFQADPDRFLDKNGSKLPQLFLHGLTTGHSQKTTGGQYCNVGIHFKSNAIKPIFGIDANELTNRSANLDSIVKNNLAEQLLNENDDAKRIGILSGFINQQILRNKRYENHKATTAIEKIANTENGLRKIQQELNISERSLERVFKTNVGVPPKLFFRIRRFQAALNQIRQRNIQSLTALAFENSYSDQSHCIREFKEFAGITPKQFLMQANERIENFFEWDCE